jgi:N-acetylglucosamine malate deacetylase 1
MKSAIAIAAHPDDIEFLMAGTLMRLGAAGYQLHYLNVANGCCGTMTHSRDEIIRIRREEGMQAAQLLGATFHESFCNDLEIHYSPPLLSRLAAIIRQVAPDIVLTHSPVDYMEDHTATCRLAVTAAFARGMPNYPTTPATPHLDKPVIVYHAQPYSNRDPLGRWVKPDLFVDTSDLLLRKSELLAAHQSQKLWLDQSQGLDAYLDTMRELDRQVGQMSRQFSHAEGWRKRLHLGFAAEDSNPLVTDLEPVRCIQVVESA